MTLWPLQNVILFKIPYQRVYIGPRLSTGYCAWFVCALSVILLPIFFAYASGGLWIKEAFYREQPVARFRQEMVLVVQNEKEVASWSTDPQINAANPESVRVPIVRYAEHDMDADGVPDELEVNVAMPMAEPAKRVLFLGVFSYQLRDTVRLSMNGLVSVEESSGIGATGVDLQGVLDFRQNNALRSLPQPRTVYETSPLQFSWTDNNAAANLSPFSLSGLVRPYLARNETIHFDTTTRIWDFAPSSTFTLQMRMRVPEQVVYYVPTALRELKHAWVHIISFMVPIYLLLWAFLGFVFSNQIVQTYACSQLPYINKGGS